MPTALIVDDDADARMALRELVEAEGFTALTAGSLAEARESMAEQPEIVLLDLMLPDGHGLDLLRDQPASADTQVIVTTAHASLESSIEALRHGATDYLLKPVNLGHLRSILSRVTGPAELRAEVSELREELRKLGRFGRLVGTSPPMQKLYDEITRVAPTGATVLVMGESGTGKELVAETIHMISRRHAKPFLAINCGAISPHLIESELFGHEKGSFTGATRQHQGYFERAHGGTLFLDEITEMPAELQVKLLRVLESRAVVRVGSSQLIETDVRVIAATNRNPEDAVKQGKLRRDLLYRLQVFPLQVVPLRERQDDVAALARHFLADLNRRANADKTFAPMVLERMRRYRWPGNVRELWNVVQRAFIMADGDIIADFSVAQDAQIQQDGHSGFIRIPLGTKLAAVEERLILTTLQECATREEAARKLGISIKTLYNRLRAYSARP
ncbi:MAG: sigma-54 dependent transcriptional regulator [Casimicrobiaceae bacterium]